MKPYEIRLGEKPFWVLDNPANRSEYLASHPTFEPGELGYLALAGFRKKTYIDYVAIAQVDDLAETETWHKVHEQYEWQDWMAGMVYDDAEREKQRRKTERELGNFLLRYGWQPNYYLETEPTKEEFDSYIEHVTRKDEVNGILLIPEESGE